MNTHFNGGCIDLEDRVYSKDELLEIELEDFINRKICYNTQDNTEYFP